MRSFLLRCGISLCPDWIKPDNMNGCTSVVEYRRTGSLTEKRRESFERFFLFLLILLFFFFLACRCSCGCAGSCWSGRCDSSRGCLQSLFNVNFAQCRNQRLHSYVVWSNASGLDNLLNAILSYILL